jgi:sugar phosphate isomerase/epimerase
MKLCTTTLDFDDYASSPAEAVRLFKGTGFKCLDFNFYRMNRPDHPFRGERWMHEIEKAAVAAEETGVTFVQAHAPAGNHYSTGEEYDHFLRTTIRSIEAAHFLGIRDIVVHPIFTAPNAPDIGRQGYLDLNKKFYEKLFPTMEKTGVNVLIENGFETPAGRPRQEKPGTSSDLFFFAEDMLEMLDHVNHPLLHACWDTGHAALRRMDQYDAIMKLGSHLRAVHIQDNFGEKDEHIAPFMGVLNMDEVMCGLIDSNFKGYFTFEATYLIRGIHIYPIYRKRWNRDTRLANPSVELVQKGISFLYEIGKSILSAYNVYEY